MTQNITFLFQLLLRLHGKLRNRLELLVVATGVSGIALMESGIFVEYDALLTVLGSMGLTQADLVRLHVLQDASIVRLNQGYILHLAKDMPTTLPAAPSRSPGGRVPKPREAPRVAPVEEQLTGQVDSDDEDQNVTVCSTQPAGGPKPWSKKDNELAISASYLSLRSVKEKYNKYCENCQIAGVIPRTYKAFEHKVNIWNPERRTDVAQAEKDIVARILILSGTMKGKYAQYREACDKANIKPRGYNGFVCYIKRLK